MRGSPVVVTCLLLASAGFACAEDPAPTKPAKPKMPTAASIALHGHKHKHEDGVRYLAFSPNCMLLATADNSDDGVVHIWDWPKKKITLSIKVTSAAGLGFVDDSTLALTQWTNPPTLGYYDVATGKVKSSVKLGFWPIPLVISPDRKLVALGEKVPKKSSGTGKLRVYEGTKRKWATRVQPDSVGSLAFTPDGKHLLMASAKKINVRLARIEKKPNAEFEVSSGKRTRTIPGGSEVVCSPDGKLIASQVESTTTVFDRATGDAVMELPYAMGTKDFRCGTFTKDGDYLIVAGLGPKLAVYDLTKGKLRKKPSVDKKQCVAMALSPDGGWLATGGITRLRVWNVSKWTGRK